VQVICCETRYVSSFPRVISSVCTIVCEIVVFVEHLRLHISVINKIAKNV
jgi:hypothetical protein